MLTKDQIQAIRKQLNAISDEVVYSAPTGIWEIKKKLVGDETHDQLEPYTVQLSAAIASVTPMTVQLVEAKPKKGNAKHPSSWVVKLIAEPQVETITVAPAPVEPKTEPAPVAEAAIEVVVPGLNDDLSEEGLAQALAIAVSGEPSAGNFKGSIRTEISDGDCISALAERYYKVLKQFYVTATVTIRQRKDERYTIAISVGELRVENLKTVEAAEPVAV